MRKGEKLMQFLQIKYPLPNREEDGNNNNNKDDTDKDITGRTNFMLIIQMLYSIGLNF